MVGGVIFLFDGCAATAWSLRDRGMDEMQAWGEAEILGLGQTLRSQIHFRKLGSFPCLGLGWEMMDMDKLDDGDSGWQFSA